MDQDFHLIEKYFQGELSQEELQLFNQKLQEDSAFEQEFRDMKLIRDAVKETSRIRALDILQQAEANLTNQETTKINVSMKRLVSIAASLLIVATVSYFAFSGGTGALTGEEIVATYYEPYRNIVETKDRSNVALDITTLRARAYNAYDIRDYSTAAGLFESLITSQKTYDNYFYSGIANFETGNLDVAINNFNSVINNFDEFKEQAQWYLALSLFKKGSQDEAISNIVLLATSETRGKYSSTAKEVLNKLDLSLSDTSSGTAAEVTNVPGDEIDPNGVIDVRQSQFGKILTPDNTFYRFFNDQPISDLNNGDLVEFILINNNNKTIAVITANFN